MSGLSENEFPSRQKGGGLGQAVRFLFCNPRREVNTGWGKKSRAAGHALGLLEEKGASCGVAKKKGGKKREMRFLGCSAKEADRRRVKKNQTWLGTGGRAYECHTGW